MRSGMAFLCMLGVIACPTSAEASKVRELVALGNVVIDLIAEGAGPPVVLLPSRGRGSEDFDAIAEGIAKAGFRVLRPQPRGAGRSTGPTDRLRMQDLARDVALVIERENNGPAVIVGHAFGNWVARMVATDHKHLVRGVALMAAAAKSFPVSLRADVQQSADETLPRAVRLAALRRAFFHSDHDPSVWLSGWAPEANRLQGIASAATGQAEYWQAGGVPILDIVPESDPFKPKDKWFESREEFGSRVTVTVVPRASHALVPEQPRLVVDVIVAWIRQLP